MNSRVAFHTACTIAASMTNLSTGIMGSIVGAMWSCRARKIDSQPIEVSCSHSGFPVPILTLLGIQFASCMASFFSHERSLRATDEEEPPSSQYLAALAPIAAFSTGAFCIHTFASIVFRSCIVPSANFTLDCYHQQGLSDISYVYLAATVTSAFLTVFGYWKNQSSEEVRQGP